MNNRTSPWRRMSRPVWHLLLVLAVVWWGSPARAAEEPEEDPGYEVDQDLAEALLKVQMLDFEALQIKVMRARYPAKKEQIDLLDIDLLIRTGKAGEARKLLEAIPATSKGYGDAMRRLAAMENDQAKKADYLKKYLDWKTVVKTDREVNEFLPCVIDYGEALVAQGKATEAVKALDYLKRIPAEEDEAKRQLNFMTAELSLSLAKGLRDRMEPVDKYKPLVTQATTLLNALIWALDYWAAQGYAELINASVLLGDPNKALAQANECKDILSQFEDSLKKKGAAASLMPMARWHLYRADAYMELARQFRTTDKVKTEANLELALKSYYYVMVNYEESKFGARAQQDFFNAKQILVEKFNKKIEVGLELEQKAKYKEGISQYKAERFPAAAETLLAGARAQRSSAMAIDCVYFASLAFYKCNRFLESMALATYLADNWPDHERTANALYNVAAALTKEAKALEDKKAPAEEVTQMREDANEFFMRFVKTAPQDPKAAKVSYRVAEQQFQKASELRKQVQKLKELRDQNKIPVKDYNAKMLEMRDAFLKAAPLYKAITEERGVTPEALKALFKLGWIYLIADQAEDAAYWFLEYCDKEPEFIDDKLDAKFYAAERLLRSDQPLDAIKHFKELLEWTGPNSKFQKSERFTKDRNDAEALLPWCYDAKAKLLLKEVDDLEMQLETLAAREAAVPEGAAKPGDKDKPDAAKPGETPKKDDSGKAPAAEPAKDAGKAGEAAAKKDEPKPGEAAAKKDDPKPGEGAGGDAKAAEGGTVVLGGEGGEEAPVATSVGEAPGEVQAVVSKELTADEIKKKIEDLRAEIRKYQDEAVGLYKDFLKRRGDDPTHGPIVLLKLGIVYVEQGNFQDGASYLEDLRKRFPNTPAAEQALFSLFRAYVQTNQEAKAKETATELIKQITDPSYSVGNLNFIAGQLFRQDERLNETALDPALALAANKELLKRIEADTEKGNEERREAQWEKAMFRAAKCSLMVKGYDAAIKTSDEILRHNKKTPYMWDLTILKARAYRAKGDPAEALLTLNEMLAYIDQRKYELSYNRGVLESARTLLERAVDKNSLPDAKQATVRLMQMVNFTDLTKVGDETKKVLEAAHYDLARAYALLGEKPKAEKVAEEYLVRFPRGAYRKDILSLPAAKW